MAIIIIMHPKEKHQPHPNLTAQTPSIRWPIMSFLDSLVPGSSVSSSGSSSASGDKDPNDRSRFFASSDSSSQSERGKGVQCNPGREDKKFSEIINDTPYKDFKEVSTKYNISISRKPCGHWFLVIEMEGCTLPNFSLEIATPDLKNIKRDIYTDRELSTPCGIIEGRKLIDILDTADRIVVEMEFYSLFTSNCQHFCNNFLNHYGFEVYRTTLGKRITAEIEKLSDKTPEQNAVFDELLKTQFSDAPLLKLSRSSQLELKMRVVFAVLISDLVGAN